MKIKYLLLTIIVVINSIAFAGINDPVKAKKGMVVSADTIASRIGVDIMRKGGNAIDAAVATGFALAVTHPQAGNIGGGGFMVIRLKDGIALTIDFREKAPAKAFKDMYLDSKGEYDPDKARIGHLSCGVPGSVAGLLMAHSKFGKLKFEDVIDPAIKLAEEGFPLHHRLAEYFNFNKDMFSKFPSSMKIFTKNGAPYKEGEIFIQKDLAETLKRIKKNGISEFYTGETAKLIVREMERGNGLITMEDLKNYNPIMRGPVRGTYRGYEIISMGPSSSGGIALIQLLNIMEKFPLAKWGWNSVKTIHYCTEAMKRVYADRAEYLGDADFVKVPVDWLISKKYSDKRRDEIDEEKATPSKDVKFGKRGYEESHETTHYSVIDQESNAVSVTYTLNGGFGNHVVVDGAGFLLNNEMDDFSSKPGVPNMFGLVGSYANAIEPNKRMLSSMTPTIVVKDNKPVLVIGSPGGSTIITTVFQVIMNVLDHKMNIQNAVDAYRFHHQWLPEHITYENGGMSGKVVRKLKSTGHILKEIDKAPNEAMGIYIDPKTGVFYGGADRRGYGSAVGY
jgi:gamma-glutamyltranspeptidase / glutathione hydrolase